MRAIVVTVWIFINLVCFGICGYVYLIWNQYWQYVERQYAITTHTQTPKDITKQLFTVNNDYRNVSLINYKNKIRIKHSAVFAKNIGNKTIARIIETNFTLRKLEKDSKPRFPNLRSPIMELDSVVNFCSRVDKEDTCREKTRKHKINVLSEYKKILLDESNAMKHGSELQNPYDVHFDGNKVYKEKSRNELISELKSIGIRTLRRKDKPFDKLSVGKLFPKHDLFENRTFNSCAVVASAGSLLGSHLGHFIDSHDVVLRFNHAPTFEYETDVGTKTTFRIVNSQVMMKPRFNFLESELYSNITMLAWDPSNYSSSLADWYADPDYNHFPVFESYMRRHRDAEFHLLHPGVLWRLWELLQDNYKERLRKNPPSSGFLGVATLLPHCRLVDVLEYLPSTRVTRKCHYFDMEDNPGCTFGSWHPLAAEKMLIYRMNSAPDRDVFQRGFMTIINDP